MKAPSRAQCYLGVILLLTLLTSCVPAATPGPTPTPTRTPYPTATPTPAPTPTPVPTPTPAFPVTASCAPEVPASACAILRAHVEAKPAYFVWIEVPEVAQVLLRVGADPDAYQQGQWTFAVAAPFFTVDDEITFTDLQATWQGNPSGAWAEHPLLLTENTANTLRGLLGEPAGEAFTLVAQDTLITEAESRNGWTLLPFDELSPRWKVLRIDGISLLEKVPAVKDYPLLIPLVLDSPSRSEDLDLLELPPDAFINRNEQAMTILAMTGVTAITRATAQLMENRGITYPAQNIKPWFEDADYVHTSNEVSFKPNCPVEASGSMSFCSDDRYIALLEEIGVNIVELTGNHLADKGSEWINHTLDMFRERGWQWFGGGENLTEAISPLRIEDGPNRIAFLGCNPIGPDYGLAAENRPGAAPCDYERMLQEVRDLRDEGYLPIVTLQYLETYEYVPTANQIYDFRRFTQAGAVIVHGSQAHQAQTFEFNGDGFIHYGPGNFFFDQMWSLGTRQMFIVRYTFYAGRLLSIDLRTALLEEYGRPRPMTADERSAFLEMMYSLSPQSAQ